MSRTNQTERLTRMVHNMGTSARETRAADATTTDRVILREIAEISRRLDRLEAESRAAKAGYPGHD